MRNKSSSEKVLLGALAAMVVLGAVFLVWRPRANDRSQVDDETSGLALELAALEAALNVAAVPTTVAPAQAALAIAVPAEPELPSVLRQISAIAIETGVDLTSLTPSELGANAGGPGGSIGISLSASGSKSAVLDYLRRLSTLERLFVVEKVSLTEAAATDPTAGFDDGSIPGTGAVQVELSGRVFTSAAAVVVEPTA